MGTGCFGRGIDHSGSFAAARGLGQRAYRNLTYFHEVDKGGHFAPEKIVDAESVIEFLSPEVSVYDFTFG
jgi:hypothetical protein